MTNQEAKMYQISQRNVHMATDNQHGVDACDKAIKALDKMERIEAILFDSPMDATDILTNVMQIVRE